MQCNPPSRSLSTRSTDISVIRETASLVSEGTVITDVAGIKLPGRHIVDTYLLVQNYDATRRELESYGLKNGIVKKYNMPVYEAIWGLKRNGRSDPVCEAMDLIWGRAGHSSE